MKSPAETLLAVQLEQAGIPFEREYKFHPSRKWRADFALWEFWLGPDMSYRKPKPKPEPTPPAPGMFD
jgi:hypothetical protein